MRMPFWSAVRSLPHREAYAAERLQGDHGFEVFLPLIQTQRASQPLFRSYLFCRIIEQWRVINSTFGVLCLVRVGDCPCRIPDHEIAALKARADASGIIRLPPPPPPASQRRFAKGEKVKIIAGQFSYFDAIHSRMRRGDLERVLINLLGSQREVMVARHLVILAQ
jgi:transcription antitermination factor NusG